MYCAIKGEILQNKIPGCILEWEEKLREKQDLEEEGIKDQCIEHKSWRLNNCVGNRYDISIVGWFIEVVG